MAKKVHYTQVLANPPPLKQLPQSRCNWKLKGNPLPRSKVLPWGLQGKTCITGLRFLNGESKLAVYLLTPPTWQEPALAGIQRAQTSFPGTKDFSLSRLGTPVARKESSLIRGVIAPQGDIYTVFRCLQDVWASLFMGGGAYYTVHSFSTIYNI